LVQMMPSVKRLMIVLLLGVLCFMPLVATTQQFLEPSGPEELKPALAYLRERKMKDDIILVYQGSSNAFDYYRSRFNIDNPTYIIGGANVDRVMNQLQEHQRPARVWVLFSHVGFDHRVDERIFILERLREYGRKVDEMVTTVRPMAVIPTLENNISAAVYLFDLKGHDGRS